MSKISTATDREIRSLQASELRATKKDEKVTIGGYAAVYNIPSMPVAGRFIEIVRRGAFAKAVAGEERVFSFYNHDVSMVLGQTEARTLRLFDEPRGLRYEVDLPATSYARDLAESIGRGDISQSSFGFRSRKDRWTQDNTGERTVEVRELLDVELFEISPVWAGQYEQADVALRSLDSVRNDRAAADARRRIWQERAKLHAHQAS